jgi:hypothetical protein
MTRAPQGVTAARVGAVDEEQARIRHTNDSRTGSFFSPPTKLV